jgi:hypothetical protein
MCELTALFTLISIIFRLSLEEAAGFTRDAFGRQSMSEKRHATLDAKHTDTYQRNKKLRLVCIIHRHSCILAHTCIKLPLDFWLFSSFYVNVNYINEPSLNHINAATRIWKISVASGLTSDVQKKYLIILNKYVFLAQKLLILNFCQSSIQC